MTPPPTPPKRPPTSLPRDRDVRVTKSPAPSRPPADGEMRAMGPITERNIRIQDWDRDAETPVGMSDFEVLAWRAQRAAENSKICVLETERLRDDQREDLGNVHDRIDGLAINVGEVHTGLSDVRLELSNRVGAVQVEMGKLSGAVNALIPLVQQSISGAMQAGTLTLTAKLGVDQAQGLAEVEVNKAEKLDRVESKKWNRDVVLKVIGAVVGSGSLGAAIAALVTRC